MVFVYTHGSHLIQDILGICVHTHRPVIGVGASHSGRRTVLAVTLALLGRETVAVHTVVVNFHIS